MRVLDLFIAASGLIILSPLALILAVLIKLTSPGPVFYRAVRVGKDGRRFHLYKFRSMRADADKIGPGITASKDPRVTPVGRFLRRTKLDELPQLLNVLKGDLSLVGPRPEDPRYVALYTPEQRRVLSVRPGVTSAASLAYRHEEQILSGADWETRYIEEIMPAKLAVDLDYLSRRTVWVDLDLILRTVIAMFEVIPARIQSFDKTTWLPHRISGQRIFPLILGDGLGVALAFLLAMLFRFDGAIPDASWRYFAQAIPFIILLYCLINLIAGLYAHIWRYASAEEVAGIVVSTSLSSFLLSLAVLMPNRPRPMPISVVILGGFLSMVIFTTLRYRQRLLTGLMGRLQKVVGRPDRRRVLIVGAGESGQMLARQLRGSAHREHYELVGFVDDDSSKLGLRLHGLPILGGQRAIPALVAERNVSLIVIAVHNISGPALRKILAFCLETEAQVKMLPDFLGKTTPFKEAMMRDIAPADLLGRQPYQVDKASCLKLLSGKTVLVTGAAGSIGSELCRQILGFQPRRLVMLDNNETGLHDLTLSLPRVRIQPKAVIADVSRAYRMEQVFQKYRPQIVFHAAAYKHVPLMEQYPQEAVRVNVLGTRIVSDLAAAYRAERFVLISSDKAVNPSSVMGATKRLGEILIMNKAADRATNNNGHTRPKTNGRNGHNGYHKLNGHNDGKSKVTSNGDGVHPAAITYHTPVVHNGYNDSKKHSYSLLALPTVKNKVSVSTLFTAVRFGNVLGSRGSVVPTFARQIERGGPITVTHPEMTRYFMSIPEAVSLIIQAASLTTGGDIFMLDMGQQIRIADLAHKMIRLRGLRPGQDIAIEYTGIRPGEKLHEELITSDEERQATSHPQIFRIHSPGLQIQDQNIAAQIARLIELPSTQQDDMITDRLWKLIHKPEVEAADEAATG